MALSIKHEATEQLSCKLAALTGETLTEAIRVSVAERYERLKQIRQGSFMADELRAIAVQCAQGPVIAEMSAQEILGCDDCGAPTRLRWT